MVGRCGLPFGMAYVQVRLLLVSGRVFSWLETNSLENSCTGRSCKLPGVLPFQYLWQSLDKNPRSFKKKHPKTMGNFPTGASIIFDHEFFNPGDSSRDLFKLEVAIERVRCLTISKRGRQQNCQETIFFLEIAG